MKQLLAPLVCLGLLSGCALDSIPGLTKSEPAPVTAPAVQTLVDTGWMLPIPKGSSCEVPPMMEFEDGAVSGDLGCNRFTAKYSRGSDGAFAFTDVKAGSRTCGKDFMDLEARMLKILRNTAAVRQEKASVTFLDKSGAVIERLVPEKAGACE
ncbi:MAG: META domain-containing protein [Duodenibacillus sp.]|nr:META domain-containing protein [Duodenibacillus sp.]